MKTKNILLLCLTIFIISIITIVFLIHKKNINIANFCTHTTNLQDIKSCRYNQTMTYQQKYDMYYNNASKYYYDDFFYGGFDDALQACNTYKSECNLHDENVFLHLLYQCAEYGGESCSDYVLHHWDINNKPYYIKIFENSSLKNQSCINDNFFKHLTVDEKKSINPQVLKLCE
jgi:hypothetical protein